MEIVNKKIGELKPYEKNPRKNDASVELVANSIKEFGFKVPLVIDKNNVIVTGHTRYKAAIRLGIESVPCVIADDLTDKQIKAFRIADNKVGEVSEWDDSLLELELFDLQDFPMDEFGFDFSVNEPKETAEKESRFNAMELKAFEHHDYIVFVFDNQMDWLNAVTEFGLRKVNGGYGTTKKIGVGRVLRGEELLKRIGHKDSDIE